MPNAKGNMCVHCGADCGKHPVVWNDLKFCCNGCKTVYQILNKNKLYTYYKIEETPGIKVDIDRYDSTYAYLDKEDVQEKIFEFKEGNIAKVNFFVPVIHCASCIWLLENLRALHKGVKHSSVHFVRKEVSPRYLPGLRGGVDARGALSLNSLISVNSPV